MSTKFEGGRKKYQNEEFVVKKEILVQFSPLKFEFIHLDKNIFDFIEQYLRMMLQKIMT